jgi:hypothetical protein
VHLQFAEATGDTLAKLVGYHPENLARVDNSTFDLILSMRDEYY